MTPLIPLRQFVLGLALGFALVIVGHPVPPAGLGVTSAHAQNYNGPVSKPVSDEFVAALAPYGEWRPHPRWGEVWVPFNRPREWRPYTYGRWVYTDDWGWYWISDDEEAHWGWVAYHYGRWVHDPRSGWFWVPGDEWAPAWVDWRRGDDYLGWAPMPPDDLIESVEYIDDPSYWVFIEPRYFTAVRVFTYVLPLERVRPIFHRTILVNRTTRFDGEHRRVAVNSGIAPGIIAAVGHKPIPTYRVRPQVLRHTQGVTGASVVRPLDLIQHGSGGGARRPQFRTEIQPTSAVIHALPSVPKPEPFPKQDLRQKGTAPVQPHDQNRGNGDNDRSRGDQNGPGRAIRPNPATDAAPAVRPGQPPPSKRNEVPASRPPGPPSSATKEPAKRPIAPRSSQPPQPRQGAAPAVPVRPVNPPPQARRRQEPQVNHARPMQPVTRQAAPTSNGRRQPAAQGRPVGRPVGAGARPGAQETRVQRNNVPARGRAVDPDQPQ